MSQAGVGAGQPFALLLVNRVELTRGLLQGGGSLGAGRRVSQSPLVLHPRPTEPRLYLPAMDLVAGLAAADILATLVDDLRKFLCSRVVRGGPNHLRLCEEIAGCFHELLSSGALALLAQAALQPAAFQKHVAQLHSRGGRQGMFRMIGKERLQAFDGKAIMRVPLVRDRLPCGVNMCDRQLVIDRLGESLR